MAMTDGEFNQEKAKVVANAYAEKFGTAPDVLHMQTGDGAKML
jgi:galactokinase